MQKSVMTIILFFLTSLGMAEKADAIQWPIEQKKSVAMFLEKKENERKIINFSMKWKEEKRKATDIVSIWQEKPGTLSIPFNTNQFRQSCIADMTTKHISLETERCLRKMARLKKY